MKRIICGMIIAATVFMATALTTFALTTYTVQKGDSLWRIAKSHQIGLSEIKDVNRDIKNYDLIYPGQIVYIPEDDSQVSSFEAEVVRLVNQERSKQGIAPLVDDWQLSRVARYKSEDMMSLGYFSHNSPTYGSPFEMMRSFGISYRSAGENIARGYLTPAAVVAAWMNSPGHRANILNSTYTHIGVGYVKTGNHWTQMFISK